MPEAWKRRATIGGLVLALGFVPVVVIAAAPGGTTEPIERRTTERMAHDDMGRGEHGSTEFPTPVGPKLTCLDDYATRHMEWCQDWVSKLIRMGISPYDDAAGTLAP